MWLIEGTPALFTDLYELTMAQVYYRKGMEGSVHFEVTVRHPPLNWGFFVMAGLPELRLPCPRLSLRSRDCPSKPPSRGLPYLPRLPPELPDW